LPLVERKAELKKIIQHTDIQSDSFDVDGAEVFAHACKVGLEGVVSKVRDSSYLSGRGNDWVKKTCAQRETLTIASFALDGNDWDGIYVGRRNGGVCRKSRPPFRLAISGDHFRCAGWRFHQARAPHL
jgi:bifunctional non-homologous end joining protein LigD